MTKKQQGSVKQEEEISLLFENARLELDAIDQESQKEKKQVIKDLAKHLEGMIPTDTICIEIVTQLRGKVSGRFIRECLEDKYKQKHRAENARKQKLQEQDDNENLAALPPLNHEEPENMEVVITQGIQGRSIDENEQEKNPNLPPACDNAVADDNSTTTNKTVSEQLILKDQSKQHLRECSSCKELYLENCELKEVFSRQTTLITANNIHTYEIFRIPKEKYPNLEEAMQRSRDSISVVVDKSGVFDRAVSDIYAEGN